MAGRKALKNIKYLAKLADKSDPCAFCKRNLDEETIYGKLYSIGDIYCHYFCVLLSSCVIQKGKDEEGLFGFLYPEILAEIERSKKHKCSYCGVKGATLGCSVAQCKKQFHLPCGRERNAVSLYFGNYKTYCEKHAPKQKLTNVVMEKAKSRLARIKKECRKKPRGMKSNNVKIIEDTECTEEPETLCVICYENVDGFPTTQTFWPPCCARDAWLHRSCLQHMALNAGVHFLKCPLCNDKDTFTKAVLAQGYYIPDRDAAWELEHNAFSEIYERPVECRVEHCKCRRGRKYDAKSGIWVIKLCILCGSPGSHTACCSAEFYVCAVCQPAAPDDTHLAVIDAVSLPSQNPNAQCVRTARVMPSRMSCRRTNEPTPHSYSTSSTSQDATVATGIEHSTVKTNTELSREDLNLKTPKRPHQVSTKPTEQKLTENVLLSPIKLLKQGLNGKMSSAEMDKVIFDAKLLDEMRRKFKKPKPLCVKRKIIGTILERLLDYVANTKNAIEWNSPEKFSRNTIKKSPKTEGKENISDYSVNISSVKTNDDLPTLNHTVETPENNISNNPPKENNSIQLNICENANLTPLKPGIMEEDSSSSSPFQLPPEFIADSSNSLPVMDTPKKLKKINIQNDSMEISENNQIVNIDLVKVESVSDATKDFQNSEKKCAFKLSPLNKDLTEKNLDIDLESFKNQYLNEVDRKTKCKLEHNHANLDLNPTKLKTAIDFALDAIKESPKRKLPDESDVASKKRKTTKMVRKNIMQPLESTSNKLNSDKSDITDNIRKHKKRDCLDKVLRIDKRDNDKTNYKDGNAANRKLKKKHKNANHNTKFSNCTRNISVKVRFKSRELNLEISKPKKRGRKVLNNTPKVLKQYVLRYPVNEIKSPQDCIIRPDSEVAPMKRKYLKSEKSSDHLKQTSIANFFKISPKS